MKIATWNVNSLKVRLPHLLGWMKEAKPDVIALQETKLVDELFPIEALQEAGLVSVSHGQKTYNGVALLSFEPLQEVEFTPAFFPDTQARLVAATYQGIRIVNVYVPNGMSVGSEKYAYKLQWLSALKTYLHAQLQQYPKLIVLGDFNIAPDDRDVYDPLALSGQVLVSEQERSALKAIMELGLLDGFRLLSEEIDQYSWWDYRAAAFRRNMGLRIDLILVSEALKSACLNCLIDKTVRKLERPSDHAPVILELA